MIIARFLCKPFSQAKNSLEALLGRFQSDIKSGLSDLSAFQKYMPEIKKLQKTEKDAFIYQALNNNLKDIRGVYDYFTKEQILQQNPALKYEMMKVMIKGQKRHPQKQIKLAEECLQLLKKHEDIFWSKGALIDIESTLGRIYRQIDEDKSVEYYKKAISSARELIYIIENISKGYSDQRKVNEQFRNVVNFIFNVLNKDIYQNIKTQNTSLSKDVIQLCQQTASIFPQITYQLAEYYMIMTNSISCSLNSVFPKQILNKVVELKDKAWDQILKWQSQQHQFTKQASYCYVSMIRYECVLNNKFKEDQIQNIKKQVYLGISKVCEVITDVQRREDIKSFLYYTIGANFKRSS